VLFVVVAITLGCLTLGGLVHSAGLVIDAQQAQHSADAVALACVIYGQDSVGQFVKNSDAEIVDVISTDEYCQVTIDYHNTLRNSFAATTHANHLPTLQR